MNSSGPGCGTGMGLHLRGDLDLGLQVTRNLRSSALTCGSTALSRLQKTALLDATAVGRCPERGFLPGGCPGHAAENPLNRVTPGARSSPFEIATGGPAPSVSVGTYDQGLIARLWLFCQKANRKHSQIECQKYNGKHETMKAKTMMGVCFREPAPRPGDQSLKTYY